MAQNENNNQNNDSYFKALINYLLGKLYKSQIFTTEEIEEEIRRNAYSINQIQNPQTKMKVLESLGEVSAIDSDFKDLKYQYLNEATDNVNITNFKDFIKRAYSGFYYSKAKKFFAIRSFLIIPQILFVLILLFPMIQSKSIDKLDKIKFYLRALVTIPDAIFFFYEYNVLKNLERKKIIKPIMVLIIVLQLTKFTCNLTIFFIDLLRDNCNNSLGNENIFILNNIIIGKMENIYNLLKFWI